MKRLIVLIFMFVSICSFAQKIEYCYQVQSGKYDKYSQKWTWSESMKRDIMIKLEGSIIYIYNNANTIITTYDDLGEKYDFDKDGDGFKSHTWKAYDDKSRKCIFAMTWYTELPIVVYSIIYGDMGFRFYMNNDKLSNF